MQFRLEDGSYTETLIWISGFGYALTELAKARKARGVAGIYCPPREGHIGSKPLLELLNAGYEGRTISSEEASRALLGGVVDRFPCP